MTSCPSVHFAGRAELRTHSWSVNGVGVSSCKCKHFSLLSSAQMDMPKELPHLSPCGGRRGHHDLGPGWADSDAKSLGVCCSQKPMGSWGPSSDQAPLCLPPPLLGRDQGVPLICKWVSLLILIPHSQSQDILLHLTNVDDFSIGL